jgi:5-methylthioadenosine/S-adenosylhomocysteine deaminase
MASNIPARIAYIDDKVGTLAPGMLADFFLVGPTEASAARNPYDALVAGNVTNIDLVVIGGVPIYGDPLLLGNLRVKTEPTTVCSTARALNSDALPADSGLNTRAAG